MTDDTSWQGAAWLQLSCTYPKVLSHCERRPLILNEDLTCCLSSASGASHTDRRPDSLSIGGIKLAPIFGSLSAKWCYRVYVKDKGEVV